MKKDKTELFETTPIPSAVAKLSIPVILSTVVMVIYNAADTYFVGLLSDPVQTAAVSLGAPMLLAFNAVTNLFGTGGSSMMSRSLGRKDVETARDTAAFCFWLALSCAVLISAAYSLFRHFFLDLIGADSSTAAKTAEYLRWTVSLGAVPAIANVMLSNMVRSEGEAMHASVGVMSGCFLNIILDPFFILPRFLNMGAAGAGLATMLSNCFAMLYLLVFVFRRRKSTIVCLNPRRFAFRGDIFREVFGVGVPASIQNLLNVTGSIILNNFAAVYGPAAVSAIGISHKVSLLPLYIALGMTQGVMPLIGYNYSSGNRTRMKQAIVFVLKLGTAITLLISAAVFAFSPACIRLFIADTQVIGIGGKILRAMSLGIPFLCVDFTAVAVYQAIGKGKISLAFAVARKLLLEIPAIIILNRLFPLYGMGYSQPFAEFVLSIAAVFMLRKIFRDSQDLAPYGT